MAQTAPVTIITKYGFKKPSLNDLQQGELGIDLLGHVLYTRNSSNEIIEVGGGTVDWSQIDPDSFPDEITNILDGTWEILQAKAHKTRKYHRTLWSAAGSWWCSSTCSTSSSEVLTTGHSF